jgi:hypothetical protein
MRFQVALFVLHAVQHAAGAALFGGVLTSEEVVEGLIHRPNLLPESSTSNFMLLYEYLLISKADVYSPPESKN